MGTSAISHTLELSKASRPAVVILVKAPRPGTVKTRLARDIGTAAATAVYRCLAADVVALVDQMQDVQPYIAFTPDDAAEEIRALAAEATPEALPLFPQRGPDLGARMTAALEKVWRRGHRHILLLGSDSPQVPLDRLEEALRVVEQTDLVLGPATDGGYYLLGARRPLGNLLHEMAWSTEEVLTQTCQRARQAGWSVTLLAEGYDIDTAAELLRLRTELRAWKGPPERRPCPRTWNWLRSWEEGNQRMDPDH